MIADRLWPAMIDRQFETNLIDLIGTGSTRAEDWRPLGPPFFIAGLAVTLASLPEFDRRTYLGLAEDLQPGATTLQVYAKWLAETPLPPGRFLPMVRTKLASRG